MFAHSSFAMGVKGIIISLLSLYRWIIIIRVVISWINPDPDNPIVQFLRSITDPALDGLRRYVPRFLWSTGLDFTPLLLIVLLQMLIMLLENIYI